MPLRNLLTESSPFLRCLQQREHSILVVDRTRALECRVVDREIDERVPRMGNSKFAGSSRAYHFHRYSICAAAWSSLVWARLLLDSYQKFHHARAHQTNERCSLPDPITLSLSLVAFSVALTHIPCTRIFIFSGGYLGDESREGAGDGETLI